MFTGAPLALTHAVCALRAVRGPFSICVLIVSALEAAFIAVALVMLFVKAT